MHVGCGVSSCAAAALRASSGVIRSSRPSFQVSEDRSIEDGTAPQRIVSLIGRKKLADRNGMTLGREPLTDRTIMFADCRNRLSSTSLIMHEVAWSGRPGLGCHFENYLGSGPLLVICRSGIFCALRGYT